MVCDTIAVMIFVFLFGLGLILGSFVNALVWRIHEQSTSKKKRVDVRYSISRGRSMCPHCHHALAVKDLVPIASWLLLRGRCRYCRAPISVQYPLVELLMAVLFTSSYLAWPYGLTALGITQFIFFLSFVVLFVALAVYDLRWLLLPDKLVATLTVLAAAEVAVTALAQQSLAALWQPVAGAVVIFGIFWGLYQVSQGKWIGGGDVKLAIALGLIAGTPLKAALVIFAASLFGTIASLPLLVRGKSGFTQHIPFGPYLLAACYLVVLYGDRLVSWYTDMLL